jgi:hypothetical protein
MVIFSRYVNQHKIRLDKRFIMVDFIYYINTLILLILPINITHSTLKNWQYKINFNRRILQNRFSQVLA